jgi:hypothetical protein
MRTENCGRCGNSFSYDDGSFSTPPRSGGFLGFSHLCNVCAAREDTEEAERKAARERASESDRFRGAIDAASLEASERDARMLSEQRRLAEEQFETLERIEAERAASEIARVEREAELRNQERHDRDLRANQKAIADSSEKRRAAWQLLNMGDADAAFRTALDSELLVSGASLDSLHIKLEACRILDKPALRHQLMMELQSMHDFDVARIQAPAALGQASAGVKAAMALFREFGGDPSVFGDKNTNWGKWRWFWAEQEEQGKMREAAARTIAAVTERRLAVSRAKEAQFFSDTKENERRASELKERLLEQARARLANAGSESTVAPKMRRVPWRYGAIAVASLVGLVLIWNYAT